uniref:Uncharacterized protein n=1 Tax=Oryza punctata TaxID=4537 RepID=A0A0E0JT38_ORYPU
MARRPTRPFAQPKLSTSQPRQSKWKGGSQCVERRRGSGKAKVGEGEGRGKWRGAGVLSFGGGLYMLPAVGMWEAR